MELYILDSLLRRQTIVDNFESLIWTERFNSAGDFELVMQSSVENKRLFKTGTWLALSDSFRCMKVETVEDDVDEEGTRILKVSGPSIEFPILDGRVAYSAKDDLTTVPKWTITDQPADIARTVFTNICVTGTLDADDIIPFITGGTSPIPASTIPEPPDAITVEIKPDTVYNVIKSICEPYDLGFRLVRQYDTSHLIFEVYAGSDRTSQQNTNPVVIFSPEFENLTSTNKLETIAGEKNIAYVYSNLGFEEVVAPGVDPSIAGFERKVLVVVMDDFDAGTSAAVVTSRSQARGLQELANTRAFLGFDGEVSEISQYTYGVDYQLGDLVEMQDDHGTVSIVRVTEQIFASDSEGERSYPTLSIRQTVTTGSWLEEGTDKWVDYDALTTHWSDKP
jgi:hypothetical protein